MSVFHAEETKLIRIFPTDAVSRPFQCSTVCVYFRRIHTDVSGKCPQ
jgi:hypothetical protein